jgi:predicted Zn-dependent protease
MEQHFDTVCAALFDALEDAESLSISMDAESSQFTRVNGGKVRQTGAVDDISLALELVADSRRATSSATLSGEVERDIAALQQELKSLRAEVALLPHDPYIVAPAAGESSRSDQQGDIPSADEVVGKLLPALQGIDISGIWASGRIYRANANSAGSRHWFASDSFSLDYSLVNPQEKMVKATYAGSSWNQAEYEQSINSAQQKLEMLDQPSIQLKPGNYRTYIAAAGVSDLLAMFSWNGLSESAMQTGESAFLRMRAEDARLSPLFSLSEDFSAGRVPRFNDKAEMSPECIELIAQGELKTCLVSSRTASEYGVASNNAAEGEYLRSPVMAAGELAEQDVLAALGTGVYLSNLHYLNWSDTHGGRITGMTRYACFWVEDGEIVGPIENMRWDDSFYHFFGENLEAVTAESQLNPDVGTYGGRELGGTECPGILLSSFALTL